MARVIVYGFGSLGRWSAEILIKSGKHDLVGVIDIDPAIVGKDVSMLTGFGKSGLEISRPSDIDTIDAEVVIHSTITPINTVLNQVQPCLELGMHVITTSEEMVYPWKTHPEISTTIDGLAKRNGAVITATGVNPGFTTDLLPLVLCGASSSVDSIQVKRVVDFSEYPGFKPPFMGFGMAPDDFRERVKNGVWGIGRNPLPGRVQNIYLIADTLGWDLSATSIRYEPIVSNSARKTPWGFDIEPGQVAGVTQVGSGIKGNKEKIRLESTAICHPLEEDGLVAGNVIIVEGNPSHTLTLDGGTVQRGGYVSSARQVNMIPLVLTAEPGLRTMRDLPSILSSSYV